MSLSNPLIEKWKTNNPVINGWLGMPCSLSAEIMANSGFDSLTVDMQHGVIDYQTCVTMFQAMRSFNIGMLARVPWLEPGIIMKTLDAGAHGIICPMINNRQEAEKLVSYMRYPPLGTRSFGPTRANIAFGPNYYDKANENLLCFAMIETKPAMDNLEEIVTTPGLDGVYIGPADLTLGLTEGRLRPGMDPQDAEIVGAIKAIIAAAHKAGIKAAIHTGGPAFAAKAIGWGMDLVTIGNDVRLLATGAQRSVNDMANLLGKDAAAGPSSDGGY